MYTQITFSNISEEIKEIMIATLQDAAEGFEENDNNLKIIFLTESFNEQNVRNIATAYQLSFQKEEIANQNWNALWESNFDPVIVDDFVGIRASFHQPINNVLHEIIITPKMSFGTGHHATTHLMMQQMQNIDFNNKAVFDFGTGTGVLAILAQKLGATNITANDIDEWSILNAKENFEHNKASNIKLIKSDSAKMDGVFDIILANINRNVLVENMPLLAAQLLENGILILSGILETDEIIIKNIAGDNQLNLLEKTSKNNWICLSFKKQ